MTIVHDPKPRRLPDHGLTGAERWDVVCPCMGQVLGWVVGSEAEALVEAEKHIERASW